MKQITAFHLFVILIFLLLIAPIEGHAFIDRSEGWPILQLQCKSHNSNAAFSVHNVYGVDNAGMRYGATVLTNSSGVATNANIEFYTHRPTRKTVVWNPLAGPDTNKTAVPFDEQLCSMVNTLSSNGEVAYHIVIDDLFLGRFHLQQQGWGQLTKTNALGGWVPPNSLIQYYANPLFIDNTKLDKSNITDSKGAVGAHFRGMLRMIENVQNCCNSNQKNSCIADRTNSNLQPYIIEMDPAYDLPLIQEFGINPQQLQIIRMQYFEPTQSSPSSSGDQ